MDNGSNFVSKTMREYCTTMGIEQIKTSPYHPQTDGMVERFNVTLKRLLRKLTQNSKVGMNAFLMCCGRTGELCTKPQCSHPTRCYMADL